MKKKSIIKFFIVLLSSILLTGCDSNNNVMMEEDLAIPLGDTGISVKLPSEYGFEAKTSELNDFFGYSANEEWSIIVNHEEKEDFTGIDQYAQASAIANEAGDAKLASDGNYYFEYTNSGYHFYTAVRQNDKYYYRVAFYCLEEDWSKYESEFAEWATTIKFEQ